MPSVLLRLILAVAVKTILKVATIREWIVAEIYAVVIITKKKLPCISKHWAEN